MQFPWRRPATDAGMRDFRSTLLDDLWRHISLATEAPSDSFEL